MTPFSAPNRTMDTSRLTGAQRRAPVTLGAAGQTLLSRAVAGLGLAVLAASCATTADIPPSPPQFAAAADGVPADLAAADPDAVWLSQFASPELEALVAEAMTANPTLRAAEQRAIAAKDRAKGAAGGWWPDLSLGFGQNRTETPIGGGDRARVDLTSSQLVSTWEADLWGRVLDGVNAADADARSAMADADAARLSIASQTARAWIDVIEARDLLVLSREDLSYRRDVLDRTEQRFARGLVSALAVRTARSQVAAAEAAEAAQADAVKTVARRLQGLLGRYPDAALQTTAALPQLGAITASGSPMDLLARRPDVAAAEARLQAAGFRVNQARKALLPSLTIRANASGSGDGLRDVTDIDGLATQVLASLAMPVFNGGQLRAEARAAQASARASAADYVDRAINAWTEVENALSADQSLAVRETALSTAATEAREAQGLAERQYSSGLISIFDLINAYTRRIDSERGLIQVRAERASNRIRYHAALGGGGASGGLDPVMLRGRQGDQTP
jgi:NodT family efflux transporter outer membrane factor (OMF) lipoprotein